MIIIRYVVLTWIAHVVEFLGAFVVGSPAYSGGS